MRAQESFNCTVEHGEDRVLVRPFGELDCWTVTFVEQRLLDGCDAGVGLITLDLGGLSFLDSSAVALVIRWTDRSVERGFQFRVLAGTDSVRRVFEITATTHLLADAAQAA